MKRLSALIILLTCLITLSACSGTPSGNGNILSDNGKDTAQKQSDTSSNDKDAISEETAKQTALDHAGFSEADVTFIRATPDSEDGRRVYDVEFYVGMNEYDYEIDAYTSEILSFDSDIEGYIYSDTADISLNGITIEEAKQIALDKAALSESDVKFTDTETDHENGRKVYQIDFISDKTEYEVEIDAETGEILEYNTESIFD